MRKPVYRGMLRRLWMHYFGYGTKMWPWHVNRLKKDIRKRLATEDYTCRLPKIKPRVRYRLTTYHVWKQDSIGVYWVKVWR